ncbi:hypothetical protein GT755_19435 [Herbidospora sp. NEAU-GS84]|uniref:Uncharacterized protein n=1 Tax=Herbidospora solisilvae TaxID=2696284 RepID=A0A7C9NIF2_9ACTN|nr:hypothetical protein [Herbidospora solisilvae]NAS23858.1 hypothetical protein [Herbidospora solisilvae]
MTDSPVTVRHVTVDYEWALEGKPPGSYNDYEVLSHSDGLSLGIFDEIRSRYATGATGDQPQVTIAFAATRQPDEGISYYVVLALQNEWSGHRDGTNRKIYRTRWYYIPYDRLAGQRISYEALYDAFKDLADTRPPTVAVRAHAPLPPDDGLYGDATSAAALLMTGKHVCVLGADGVPMIERLRFVDEVAALLPYGMRTRLTAATWVSATAGHKIRLSFAKHAAEGTHVVTWRQGAPIPAAEPLAREYAALLSGHRVPPRELVERLAEKTSPISFDETGCLKARNLLEDCALPDAERASRVVPEEPRERDTLPKQPPPLLVPERPPITRLVGSLRMATQDSEVAVRLRELLNAIETRADRMILQSAMLDHNCFEAPFGTFPHPEPRYTEVARAAFTSDTCRTEIADALLRNSATPKQVKSVIRAMRGERSWLQRILPGNVKYVVSGSALAIGLGLFFYSMIGLFAGPEDVAPPVDTATPVVTEVRQSITVHAEQSDRYLADIYAQMLRNQNYHSEVREFTDLNRDRPHLVITASTASYPGYQVLLTPPAVRNTLIFNADKIKADDLPDELNADDGVVAVRTDFSDEDRLKAAYPRLKVTRMSQKDIVGALEKGDVVMAVLPSGLPLTFERSPLLDEVLPSRTIHVLGKDLPPSAEASLTGVSAQLVEEWQTGPAGMDPQESARKSADLLMPPSPALVTVSAPPMATISDDEAGGVPGSVLLFVASILLMVIGLFVFLRTPSYVPRDR